MLFGLFLSLAAAAGIMLAERLQKFQAEEDCYRKIAELAGDKGNTGNKAIPPDFEALKKINPDCVAYLYCKDVCSYPVVKTEDDSYYLDHLFDGTPSEWGAIFMDPDNRSTEDKNCILYGHNMYDGSMFGALYHFEEEDYYKQHRKFRLFTEDDVYSYEVIGAFRTPVSGPVYRIGFLDEKEYLLYQEELFGVCRYLKDAVPSKDARILTLSTCTQDSSESERFVVILKRIGTEAR